MRVLPLVLLLAFAASSVFAAAPAFPATESQSGPDGICQLSGLAMDNGFTISPTFAPNVFEYTCGCSNWNKVSYGSGSPTVSLRLLDGMSVAQVWFNGVGVNTEEANNALQNPEGTGLAQSAPLATADNPWVVGENRIQILTHCSLPHNCEYQYTIVCDRPEPGDDGFMVGDPSIVGLRGQQFQVHGVAGEVYNIVSDRDVQYNSRFVFLNQGDCPVVNGRKQKGCWSHPGSFLGELGLKTRAGDQIRLISGPARTGFMSIDVNGKQLEVGDTVLLAGDLGSVSFNSTHVSSVDVGRWHFSFENSDSFVNQRVRVDSTKGIRAHGLLGQTWNDATYSGEIKYVQGEVDDYVIREKELFGDSFVYNRFN